MTGDPQPDPGAFRIGGHLLRLARRDGRWTVTIDSVAFDRWFTTPAAAWEAGVREVDRLDRPGAT
jgi:hypothetical protein